MKLTSKMIGFLAVLALAVVPAVALAHGLGSSKRHYPGPHASTKAKKHAYGKVCRTATTTDTSGNTVPLYPKKKIAESVADPTADAPGEDKNAYTDTDGDKHSLFVNCVVTAAKAAKSAEHGKNGKSMKVVCQNYSHKKDADGDYHADVSSKKTDPDPTDSNETSEGTAIKGTPFSNCVHTMKQVKHDVRHGRPA